jgi:hypothetical protein
MATYKEIQGIIRNKYGFAAKTCWIADVMSRYGLTARIAANRIDKNRRSNPCPLNRSRGIEDALKNLGMIT